MADTLRITFELDLPDNPPLYQDLIQFPKGQRRVNRLRTLAHAGLIAQLGAHAHPPQGATPPATHQDTCMTEATLELFGPAASE
jgi:hypothetical protein